MLFKVNSYTDLQAALERMCDGLLAQGMTKDSVFDCKLVACELLGNALKYGGGEASLLLQVQEQMVVLKVASASFFALPEQITCSHLFAESGRGLFLVNTLCEGQIFTEEDGIVAKIRIEK
jgi:anti-sigma regulatory factor (Ser/Thr protein kinase)